MLRIKTKYLKLDDQHSNRMSSIIHVDSTNDEAKNLFEWTCVMEVSAGVITRHFL